MSKAAKVVKESRKKSNQSRKRSGKIWECVLKKSRLMLRIRLRLKGSSLRKSKTNRKNFKTKSQTTQNFKLSQRERSKKSRRRSRIKKLP